MMLSDRSLKPTRARVPHSAMLAVASSPDRRGGAAPLTAFHESRVREKTIHSAASRGRHRSLSGELREVSASHPELAGATPEKGNSGAVKRLERNSRDGGSSVTSRASIGSSGMTVNAKAAQNVGRSPLWETQDAAAASAEFTSALYNLLSLMRPSPSQGNNVV